jgi:large subunit ribosomal protein L35
MRTKGGKSHLRRRRSRRAKVQLNRMQEVKGRGLIKRIKRLAPNMEE